MDDLIAGSGGKAVNGKPPLPPQRPKPNRTESMLVLSPILDDMLPPNLDASTDEPTTSKNLVPRPGGFIKKLVGAEDEEECMCKVFDETTVLTELRPYFAAPTFEINDALLDVESHGWSPELRRVLSAVVSTVMLLAHGEAPCPPENLQWTYDFLINVRDEKNRLPPNIRWLLNYILNLKQQTPDIKTEPVEN